jgi:hypothetical protein
MTSTRTGVTFRQKLITRHLKELDTIGEKKDSKSIQVGPKLPANVKLLPEFENAHKGIRLSSNNKDFDKDSLMERMMISRYNHVKFDP